MYKKTTLPFRQKHFAYTVSSIFSRRNKLVLHHVVQCTKFNAMVKPSFPLLEESNALNKLIIYYKDIF